MAITHSINFYHTKITSPKTSNSKHHGYSEQAVGNNFSFSEYKRNHELGFFSPGTVNTVKYGISGFSYLMGTVLKYSGAIAFFIMAAVGTVSVDLVLLAYAEKQGNQFLTGYILGSMMSSNNSMVYLGLCGFTPLLIASLVMSSIAVAISFALEVSAVGVAIMAGWGIAATLFGSGLALLEISKCANPDKNESELFFSR